MSGELIGSALNLEQAIYTRRYRLWEQNNAIIDHRVYISQTVNEFFFTLRITSVRKRSNLGDND